MFTCLYPDTLLQTKSPFGLMSVIMCMCQLEVYISMYCIIPPIDRYLISFSFIVQRRTVITRGLKTYSRSVLPQAICACSSVRDEGFFSTIHWWLDWMYCLWSQKGSWITIRMQHSGAELKQTHMCRPFWGAVVDCWWSTLWAFCVPSLIFFMSK